MKRYLLLISMLAAFVVESAAREVYRLNDDWTFYFRSENSADDARNITLPHTWNDTDVSGDELLRAVIDQNFYCHLPCVR